MKIYKYLVFIILIHLFLLNTNEKPIIIEENNFNEEIINNEIDPQFCFSFKVDKLINSKNNSLMTREDYLRKAGGFLFMGITGIFFIGLAIDSIPSSAILIWFLTHSEWAILMPFFIFIIFVGIGIPLLILGFYYYRFYKENKIPDPFIEENKNNEIVIFKFNFEN